MTGTARDIRAGTVGRAYKAINAFWQLELDGYRRRWARPTKRARELTKATTAMALAAATDNILRGMDRGMTSSMDGD